MLFENLTTNLHFLQSSQKGKGRGAPQLNPPVSWDPLTRCEDDESKEHSSPVEFFSFPRTKKQTGNLGIFVALCVQAMWLNYFNMIQKHDPTKITVW